MAFSNNQPWFAHARSMNSSGYSAFHLMRHLFVSGIFIALVLGLTSAQPLNAQELNRSQKNKLRQIKNVIDRAEKAFVAGKYSDSAKTVNDAIKRISELAAGLAPGQIEKLKTQYDRIAKAHELLSEKKETLSPLKKLVAGKGAGDSTTKERISFVKQVAPLLQSKCGTCHVARSRGRFSLANYEVLMRGPAAGKVIFANKPDDSRLIEVIESGDMPRGGGSVSKEELATLKTWILEGAKFDGENAASNLNELVGNANSNPPLNRLRPNLAERKNVKVSFASELAPIIVERCSGCHLETQRVRGGLNLSSFQRLLRGGDSGNLFVPGKGDDSLLIKKFLGTGGGNRMPPGKPLDQGMISKFKSWIDEGAPFDGGNVSLGIKRIAAIAKAENSSHEQMSTERKVLAQANWKLVMGDAKFEMYESENFLVVGGFDETRLKEFADLAEKTTSPVARRLKLPTNQPLVKGRTTIFLFSRRYDYAEFGKMVEQRELPRSFRGHWAFTTVDAYVALLVKRDTKAEDLDALLAQQIGATTMASINNSVPNWFADGAGYWTASKLFPKDEDVKKWKVDAEQVIQSQNNPDDFIRGRLADDAAGLVSFYFVTFLNKNSSRHGKLMSDLKAGKDFEQSFEKAFGKKPADLLKSISGDQGRRRNRK